MTTRILCDLWTNVQEAVEILRKHRLGRLGVLERALQQEGHDDWAEFWRSWSFIGGSGIAYSRWRTHYTQGYDV